MRDRLRHRPRRGVLRAAERQERRRHGVPDHVHGHHLRAHRAWRGRWHPDPHAGLWPERERRRRGVQVELPDRGFALGVGGHADPVRGPQARRHGQAQGQEDHAAVPRQPVWQGSDPGADGARQAARLRAHQHSGAAPRRGPEGALASDPPGSPRLCAAVGLGRDELHRAEGSARHRFPAQPHRGRLAFGFGLRRERRGRCRRLQRGADPAGSGLRLEDRQGSAGHAARQERRRGSEGRGGFGAVHARPDERDVCR